MEDTPTYTLDDLARDFRLTLRTARHYIENVLPPHHKTGRGKLARYGQDTWNCFAFIKKVRAKSKFTSAQLAEVLSKLDQDQVNTVAEGREDLEIVATSSYSGAANFVASPSSDLTAREVSTDYSAAISDDISMSLADEPLEELEPDDLFAAPACVAAPVDTSWQKIYADGQLRILYQGEATEEQREQVGIAAKLIKRILAD